MARICNRHKPIILNKRKQNKNIYQHGTYNLETVSEETFEMRITGEPKEPNLESFSLTWSANHFSQCIFQAFVKAFVLTERWGICHQSLPGDEAVFHC